MAISFCNSKINQQGRELIEHGTGLFPVACYHDDLLKENVPWHWHDELEVILVSEGSALIAAGTEKYVVNQGEGFFINAGILHAAWINNPVSCRFHSIVFHPRLVGGSIDSIFWQKYVHPLLNNTSLKSIYLNLSEEWHQHALDAIETAWQSCSVESFGYELQVRASLSQLIFDLVNYHPVSEKTLSEKALRNNERIKKMLLFIQEHFPDPITISMIANTALISESECLRCFRNTIGISPIQYLKQFRIQKSVDLLISSNEKISDISALCGFQDTSYFTKSFREMTGFTPTEFRRRSCIP